MTLRDKIFAELDRREEQARGLSDTYLDFARAKAASLRTWAAYRRILARHVLIQYATGAGDWQDYCRACRYEPSGDEECPDVLDLADALGIDAEAGTMADLRDRMTAARDPRWTDETENLVATAAYVDWTGHERDGLPTGDYLLAALARDRWGHIARSVLTALADAGLLVEPGGETQTQHRYRDPDGYTVVCLPGEASEGWRLDATREVTRWPDESWHFGPWQPAATQEET